MTMPSKAPLGGGPDAGDAVAEYLRKHPLFFDEHPELLTEIEVPHDSGKAISLVERQLMALRQENRQLKENFTELVDIAKENESLSRRLHALTLQMMGANSIAEVFGILNQRLREDFHADHVAIRLFAIVAVEDLEFAEFAGSDPSMREPFAELIEEFKPVCGRPKRAQYEVLMGDRGSETGSAVMMPLRGHRWDGVLMISSDDPRRYSSDMGIDLLSHLGDITSLIIEPWVKGAA